MSARNVNMDLEDLEVSRPESNVDSHGDGAVASVLGPKVSAREVAGQR